MYIWALAEVYVYLNLYRCVGIPVKVVLAQMCPNHVPIFKVLVDTNTRANFLVRHGILYIWYIYIICFHLSTLANLRKVFLKQ